MDQTLSLKELPTTTVMRWGNYLLIYRVLVYILTFLLIVAPLRHSFVFAHSEIILVALSFTSLMAFVYLLNKVTDKIEDAINIRGGPIGIKAMRPTFVVAMVCLCLPLSYLVFVPKFLPLYFAVALFGFYYSSSLPFLHRKIRLKQILFVKNTVSAIIWSLPPVGIQWIVLHGTVDSFVIFGNFVAMFCAFFAFESLWDVRDMAGDIVADVHTIANTFGVRTVQVLGFFLLSVAFVIWYRTMTPFLFAAFSVSYAFFFFASPKRSAWFYHSVFSVWIVYLVYLFLQ